MSTPHAPFHNLAEAGRRVRRALAVFAIIVAVHAQAATKIVWPKAQGANSYIIEIAKDGGFEQIVVRENVTTNALSWGDAVVGSYYFRVATVDANGVQSPFSNAASLNVLPPAPRNLVPNQDAKLIVDEGGHITLSWVAVREAKGYRVEIGKDPGMTQLVLSDDCEKSQFQTTKLETDTRYFWRVKTLGAHDLSSKPTAAQSFWVAERELPPPVLLSPEGGARISHTVAEDGVGFSWRVVGEDKDAILEVAKTADFGKALVRLETSKLRSSSVLGPGTYFWRVGRAKARAKGQYQWSETRAFNVDELPPLAPPVLRTSAGDAKPPGYTQDQDLDLSWNNVQGAEQYELELCLSQTCQDAKSYKTKKTEFSLPVTPGLYYVRLRSAARSRLSIWSAAKEFRIIAPSPSQPNTDLDKQRLTSYWLVGGYYLRSSGSYDNRNSEAVTRVKGALATGMGLLSKARAGSHLGATAKVQRSNFVVGKAPLLTAEVSLFGLYPFGRNGRALAPLVTLGSMHSETVYLPPGASDWLDAEQRRVTLGLAGVGVEFELGPLSGDLVARGGRARKAFTGDRYAGINALLIWRVFKAMALGLEGGTSSNQTSYKDDLDVTVITEQKTEGRALLAWRF